MRKSIQISNILFCFAVAIAVDANRIEAQDIDLEVEPGRCISLHRGQLCYQQLNFSWDTAPGLEYCLGELGLTGAFTSRVCWSGNELSSQVVEFESNSNIIYQIRLGNLETVVAEILVEVAWVYKSGRSTFSRWRLF